MRHAEVGMSYYHYHFYYCCYIFNYFCSYCPLPSWCLLLHSSDYYLFYVWLSHHFFTCDSQHPSLSALCFTWVTDFLLIAFSIPHASTYSCFKKLMFLAFILYAPLRFSALLYHLFSTCLTFNVLREVLIGPLRENSVWSSAEVSLCLFAPGCCQTASCCWTVLIQEGIHGPICTVQGGKGLRILTEHPVCREPY